MKQKSVSYDELYRLQCAFEAKYKNQLGEQYEEAMNDYVVTYMNDRKSKTVEQFIKSNVWQPC